MAVMCHLAIEPSDKFVLMTTVISLDSVVSHLGWEEAQRLGSLGVGVGLCWMPGTVFGSQHTLSLEFSLWGYCYSLFVDVAQGGEESSPRSHRRCTGKSFYYCALSTKSYPAEGE